MVEVGLSQVPTLDIYSLRRILGISIQLQNQFVLHLTNTLAEVLEKAKNSGDLVDLVRCPAKIKRTKHETFTARHLIWSTSFELHSLEVDYSAGEKRMYNVISGSVLPVWSKVLSVLDATRQNNRARVCSYYWFQYFFKNNVFLPNSFKIHILLDVEVQDREQARRWHNYSGKLSVGNPRHIIQPFKSARIRAFFLIRVKHVDKSSFFKKIPFLCEFNTCCLKANVQDSMFRR